MAIKVIKSGLYTTIQDLGRTGWQGFGIPVGGAMDQTAARLVNILLGNNEKEAVLEMTFVGPTLQFEEEATIAIFGANMSPSLNETAISHSKPIRVSKGDILKFGAAKKNARCYLSIKGGFVISKTLHSKSTLTSAGIGGINGKALRSDDVLPFNHSPHSDRLNWGFSYKLENYLHNDDTIRFTKGRQYDWFTDESKQQFIDLDFSITPDSNRMGYRLSGPSINVMEQKELITEGTAFGTIQIPPEGQPIILMADRQPTGGYPKIGEVIQCDLPRLSQMRPGDKLRFKEVSLLEAQQILLNHSRDFSELKAACTLKWRD